MGQRHKKQASRGKRGASIRDVAKRAGVAVSTASRALSSGSGGQSVSASARRRVLRAARELGYRVNRAARAVARQRSGLIGILAGSASGGFISRVIDGAVRVANEDGYQTTFAQCGYAGVGFRDSLEVLLEMRVEGIVLVPPNSLPISEPEVVADLEEVPVVLADLSVEGLSLPLVTGDDAGGTRQAVEHLISLGHERIAHLAGWPSMSTGTRRLASFSEVMADHGLDVPREYISYYDFEYPQGVKAALELLAAKPRPTAILAASDSGAAAVLRICRELRLSVPQDISVIGYGDTVMCDTWTPALTTVRQAKEEVGARAVTILLEQIAGVASDEEAPRTELLPQQLMVRETTGPPADVSPAQTRLREREAGGNGSGGPMEQD